jgi:hypothetical protein
MKMAKTNAERQAEYRKNRSTAGENGERRLNTYLSTGSSMNLNRLAKHYGITQREMLEKLITAADKRVTSRMSDEKFNEYIDVTA